ncbi:MAG: hypothetical protein JSW36_17205 [Burkholderiales bacterium]|nr:MAG: hypothetical protein JSW36_17205 [Burkholderiales bacterium]
MVTARQTGFGAMQGRRPAVILGLFLRILIFGACLQSSGAWAKDAIDPFVGRYAGQAEFTEAGAQIKRDLGVTISKRKDGFTVNWKASTSRPSGKVKIAEHSVDFVPTKRPNVFMSAMKTNVFGGQVPLDPMQGHPYVWARIDGDTLTVYALYINDDGGYEFQIFDRTLDPKGLKLKFERIRDGERLRAIDTLLVRAGKG